MATTIAAPPRISLPPDAGNGGGRRPLPRGTHRIGIALGLAAISMMFIGLTSAYLVNQGLGPLWKQVRLSPLIGINTAILLFSSYTMERARRSASRKWVIGTLVLGLAFLAGQIGVFGQLANEGLYLNTGRQASFYYVLTGLHGLHILGGIAALAWTAVRMKAAALEVTSIYWHFMAALWLYLLLVIFL
jgi:cytochrome c oxidase subunit 3